MREHLVTITKSAIECRRISKQDAGELPTTVSISRDKYGLWTYTTLMLAATKADAESAALMAMRSLAPGVAQVMGRAAEAE